MKTLDQFFPHVLPYVYVPSKPIVRDAIRDACIELCRRTQIWREDLAAIDVVQNHYTYNLTPSAGRIFTTISVLYDSIPVHPSGEDHLDNISPSWRRYRSVTYRYNLSFLNDQATLELTWPPTADITGGIEVRVALQPLPDDTQVPDTLYTDHKDVVADGSLAKLLGMQAEKWYDPVKANQHNRSFGDGLAKMAGEAQRSHTSRPQQVKMRPLYRGRERRWW